MDKDVYPGLSSFCDWFRGYVDNYVIIGGVANSLLLHEGDASNHVRATRDLDIVLLVEAITPDFGRAFWDYIKTAGYAHQQKSGKNIFYRFHSPISVDYPKVIELFSRQIEGLPIPADAVLTPVPISDELSSLSAILLDDEYYRLLRSGIRRIKGVPVLDEKRLILFKAKAWLELTELRERDSALVHANDISKHFSDIFNRLVLLLPQDYSHVLALPESVEDDMVDFLRKAGKRSNRDGVMYEEDKGWQKKANALIAAYGLPWDWC